MKATTYMSLATWQLVGLHFQLSGIARRQAERDAVQLRATDEAARVAQNAQYASWRVTPEGRYFELWQEHAFEAAETARSRNDAWMAIYDATIAEARSSVALPEDPHWAKSKAILFSLIAIPVAWAIALVILLVTAWTYQGSAPTAGRVALLLFFTPLAVLLCASLNRRKRIRLSHDVARYTAGQDSRERFGRNHFWHAEYTSGEIEYTAEKVSRVAVTGPAEFPAPRDLPVLARIYQTRESLSFPKDLPADSTILLAVFSEEDRRQLEQLRSAHLN